jgi:hypothetical protein
MNRRIRASARSCKLIRQQEEAGRRIAEWVETSSLMTRAEIQAVYDSGPEAVIALVERLLATISQQQAAIDALTARVKQLETLTPTRPLVFVPGILDS